jgi:PAS domain-containing protein
MVAVIGLGRSVDGALLSSEDVEILRTVSGYVAVAIENSLLYKDQQERAAELKLLKEFNESIIESINVGLLAVDLDGRVTRLNSALEHIPRLSVAKPRSVRRVEDLVLGRLRRHAASGVGTDGWRLREIRNILQTAHGDAREPFAGREHRARRRCRTDKDKQARWSCWKT